MTLCRAGHRDLPQIDFSLFNCAFGFCYGPLALKECLVASDDSKVFFLFIDSND